MEVEIYKMKYITKIAITSNEELEEHYEEPQGINEIKSGGIRILGDDFVKLNSNKAKLIINNKKDKLREFINSKDLISYGMKIKIILYKGLSNISHMFKNCIKLKEMSDYDSIMNIEDETSYEYEYVMIMILIIMMIMMKVLL